MDGFYLDTDPCASVLAAGVSRPLIVRPQSTGLGCCLACGHRHSGQFMPSGSCAGSQHHGVAPPSSARFARNSLISQEENITMPQIANTELYEIVLSPERNPYRVLRLVPAKFLKD